MTDDITALIAEIKAMAEKANAANSAVETRALTSAEHWWVNDFYDNANPATILRLISALEMAEKERDALLDKNVRLRDVLSCIANNPKIDEHLARYFAKLAIEENDHD